ncbi:hypothetical protein BZA70DRAFT_277526 [Myxozyma melibiosi]|uniref:Secreted peptide n=1 Tax=Myxozyma melibiosi TaxID=54550 RepID=A0ABR1F7Y0_9ASCO
MLQSAVLLMLLLLLSRVLSVPCSFCLVLLSHLMWLFSRVSFLVLHILLSSPPSTSSTSSATTSSSTHRSRANVSSISGCIVSCHDSQVNKLEMICERV